MPRIYKVTKISVSIVKTKPPKLVIGCDGQVVSSGWSNGRLEPRIYVMPPADGIMDFDFVADPPTGISMPVITPISVTEIIDRDPSHFWGKGKPLKGVRIHASANKMTKELDYQKSVELFEGDFTPWPWLTIGKVGGAETAGKRINPHLPLTVLLGKSVRVYRTGDMLTLDHNTHRANIEIDPKSNLVVDVWFG